MLAEAGAELTPERLWIGGNEDANSGPFRQLRARRKGPRRRATDERDELAALHGRPFHSITSSARVSIVGGRSRPNALAALRLITSSNFVGCSTGRSAGFKPLRMRAV